MVSENYNERKNRLGYRNKQAHTKKQRYSVFQTFCSNLDVHDKSKKVQERRIMVTITSKKRAFFTSKEGEWLRDELVAMVRNTQYNTKPTYTTISDDELLFVDKHMNYVSSYPNINPRQYLSNLKLKTKLS